MSNILHNIKSHLKGESSSHHPSSNNSYAGTSGYSNTTSNLPSSSVNGAPLHQTYHHEETHLGPRPQTLAHDNISRFEGSSGNVHESVVTRETIIDPKLQQTTARAAPFPVSQPLPSSFQSTRTIIEPTTVQRNVVEKPTIVKETLLPEEKIEIQPVIHREREQREVHKVVQPLHERDIMPTKVVQATLADQVRATVVENDASFQARSREADSRFASTKDYAALKSQTVQRSAIVEEHIHKTIIEEVQPVLYKETVVPVVIQETQPIYEKIVEAPIVITEERAMRDLGTQFASTSFGDQRSFQNMPQNVLPPQSFVETTTTQIIREEIPFSDQQFSSSHQYGSFPTQQWNQSVPQQFGGSQYPNQQWSQASQMPSQSFVSNSDQKLYEQNASLQKNPRQSNINSTRLV